MLFRSQFFHPVPAPTKSNAHSPQAFTSSATGDTTLKDTAPATPAVLRVIGYYTRSDGEYIVLYTDGTNTRLAKARAFIIDGYNTTGYIDGQPVAFFGAVQ